MKPERTDNEQKPLSDEKMSEYLMGNLSPKEQHALEKSALSNPFEQEALEGFETNPEVSWSKVHKDLDRRMKQRLYKEKSQFMLLTVRRWAAVIVLMLCASSIYWFLHRQQESSEMAMNETVTTFHKESDTNTTSPIQSLMRDTVEEKIIAYEDKKAEKIIANKPIDAKNSNLNRSISSGKSAQTSESANLKEDLAMDAMSGGEVAANEQVLESPPAEKNIEATKAEEAVTITEEAELAEEDLALDDVSTTDMAREGVALESKSERAKKIDTQKKDARLESQSNTNTWKEFVQKNLQYPTKAIENKVQGIVKVQFELDKKGKLSNIKITQSISEECDNEAIRLIKSFSWKDKGKREEMVEFKLE
jgi:TonB family protein